MMRRAIISVFMTLAAVQAASAQLYHPGEELCYRVSYKAKLFPNTEVANVSVTTQADTLDGRPCYRVVGNGRTAAAWRIFFDVDDTYTVWVDPETLRSIRFEGDLHEGSSYTFRNVYRYDWDSLKVHTWWQKRQDLPQSRTMTISENGMDAVSLYFNLRGIDTDALREGESRSLEMVLEDTVRTLDFRFLGREVKKVPRQGKFRTLKFACQIGTSDGFSFTDGTEFTVWISDDGNKIPLYMESPIRVGSICAYISSVSGLKYPLDSRTKQ